MKSLRSGVLYQDSYEIVGYHVIPDMPSIPPETACEFAETLVLSGKLPTRGVDVDPQATCSKRRKYIFIRWSALTGIHDREQFHEADFGIF